MMDQQLKLAMKKQALSTLKRKAWQYVDNFDQVTILSEIEDIVTSKKSDRVEIDGKYWMTRTKESWHKDCLPHLGISTINRYFDELRELGLIEVKRVGVRNFFTVTDKILRD